MTAPIRSAGLSSAWFTRARAIVCMALLASCGEDFNTPPTTPAFTVTSSSASGSADGTSIVTLTTLLPLGTPLADARVTFGTNVGAFVGGTASIVVNADENGKAVAQLKAPSSPGIALVTATYGTLTRSLQVTFTAASAPKGVTDVTSFPNKPRADGASIVDLEIAIDTSPRPTPNSVVVSTSLGSLLGGNPTVTISADARGKALAKLRAPNDTGTALLTLTSGGITTYKSIQFVPALPDAVQLTASSFELKAGNANVVTLNAVLSRALGIPSPGVTLSFSADTLGGTSGNFGQFSTQHLSATTPTATTRFTAGATSFHGIVVLRVTARAGDVTRRDSTRIAIVQ